jgi:hypothetical protein
VLQRDGRCVRCGASGSVQWHHRRSRRVIDDHVHCACNGILLCPTCHATVHGTPADAKQRGLIVSSFIDEPSSIPVKTYRGWETHDCTGNRAALPERTTE